MSPNVRHAPHHLNFQRFTSCANIAIIRGWFFGALSSVILISTVRCLGEHDTECPVCARQHSIIRQLRRDNERLAQQHDVFLAEVEDNGFSAIATAFSQGLLNVPPAEGV
jgi:hypothetical protein